EAPTVPVPAGHAHGRTAGPRLSPLSGRGQTTMSAVEQQAGAPIRPFRVDVPELALIDLRRRLAATRWPSRELVEDRSQGVQLATVRELCRYWADDYDWRACENRLNELPQFTTEIDGVDIH